MTASEAIRYRALYHASSRDDLRGANNVTHGGNQWTEHHGPHPQSLSQDHRSSQTPTKAVQELLQNRRPRLTPPDSLPDLIQDHQRPSQTPIKSIQDLLQDHRRSQVPTKTIQDLLQKHRFRLAYSNSPRSSIHEHRPSLSPTDPLLGLMQDHLPNLTPTDSMLRLIQDYRPSQTPAFPLGLTQDHRSVHPLMNASLSGAEASNRQYNSEHLHDTEAMDYGTAPTSRNSHSAYYREPQFTTGHNNFNRDSLNSNGDSPYSDEDTRYSDGNRLNPDGDSLNSDRDTDTLISPLFMIIDNMLSTPLTPTSIELTGPGGKPLRQVIETNAYRRGEYSTGDLIESFLPGRLSPGPRFVTTMQEIADRYEVLLPTFIEEDSNDGLMEGVGGEHAITRAICASPAEQQDQDPEEWYLSALSQPPLDKPLPPLPMIRSPEAVQSGPSTKGKKPARLEILPMSVYNNTYAVGQGEQFLPSPRPLPVEPAHLEAFSSSARSHRDVLLRAVSPVYSELDVHPAFRSKSSPFSQEYTPNAGHFMNAPISPSLPDSRCPSTYLRPSPESSSRPSIYLAPSPESSSRPSTYLRPSPEPSSGPSMATVDMYSPLIPPSSAQSRLHFPPSDGLPSPFTNPRPAPPTPSANQRRTANTGTPTNHAFQDLPTRSSSLAHRQMHSAGIEQFNIQHPNTPSRTTLDQVYPAPSPVKRYCYEEARYGGNDEKLEQILGLDFVDSPESRRRARILAAHQRMVDQLTGGQPLFEPGSWKLKKGGMKKKGKAGVEGVKKFFGKG